MRAWCQRPFVCQIQRWVGSNLYPDVSGGTLKDLDGIGVVQLQGQLDPIPRIGLHLAMLHNARGTTSFKGAALQLHWHDAIDGDTDVAASHLGVMERERTSDRDADAPSSNITTLDEPPSFSRNFDSMHHLTILQPASQPIQSNTATNRYTAYQDLVALGDITCDAQISQGRFSIARSKNLQLPPRASVDLQRPGLGGLVEVSLETKSEVRIR
mmetsp:Transcript_23489/g.51533  ORF Transcript_23489/g.51533 Transcript_23489/m.51533 type:complete len:213 (+) Transcript_23489:472-1110(+)